MSIFKKRKVLLPLLLLSAVCASLFAQGAYRGSAGAYNSTDYSYRIEHMDVHAVINKDFTIDITEIITINFLQPRSAYIRDLPVNDYGMRVENIRAVQADDAPARKIKVTYEDGFLSVDLHADNFSPFTGNRTYAFAYKLVPAAAFASRTELSINFLGGGFNSSVSLLTVKAEFPKPPSFSVDSLHVGRQGATGGGDRVVFSSTGNTVDFRIENLSAFEGFTAGFDLPEGTFAARADNFGLIVAAAAAVVIVLIYLLYNVKKNKRLLTPIVSFEPPDGIDPAEAGFLIDGVCTPDDLTSLIYYWANIGCVGIHMTKKASETELFKLKELPPDNKRHEELMFKGLFRNGDRVRISSLADKFYGTIESASSSLRGRYLGKLYEGKSIFTGVLFALAGALFTVFAAYAYGKIISASYINYFGFIALIPAALCFAGAFVLFMFQPKHYGSNGYKIGYLVLALLLHAAAGLVYYHLALLSVLAAAANSVVGFVAAVALPGLFSRTEFYTNILNQLTGFKNFIRTAEKSRLEKMLEQNPNYYYDVLPYANVMGVSDIWSDKFKALTVQRPYWLRGYSTFDFIMFNMMLRASFTSVSRTLSSRPSQSGRGGGGGFGGRGGDFSGGGFGGGGGRAR